MLASPAASGVDAQPPLKGISGGSDTSQEGSPLDMLDVLAVDTPGQPFFVVIDTSLSAAVEPVLQSPIAMLKMLVGDSLHFALHKSDTKQSDVCCLLCCAFYWEKSTGLDRTHFLG